MMLSDRLELLLDSTFIHYAADCYQWALDSELELNALDEKHRREVLAYHRGDDYKSKAKCLVNQEYGDVLKEQKLEEITLPDLERCWYLANRVAPKDPLGIVYGWFTSHAALYIPDRFNKVIRPIEAKNRDEVLDQLFSDFMEWAERNDHLQVLSYSPSDVGYIDEIEGLFKLTVNLLTDKNNYLNRLFEKFSDGEGSVKSTEPTFGRRNTDVKFINVN